MMIFNEKEFVISEPLQHLVARIYKLYREKQPVGASLCGSVQWDRAEDLSDQGLADYAEALKSLATDVSVFKSKAIGLTDRVVAEEIGRFVEEKLYQASVQRLYYTSFMPYFQLIAASLLPFSLNPPLPEATDERLSERLHAAQGWLDLAARRQELGFIVASSDEVSAAQNLATAIVEFIRLRGTISSRIAGQVDQLCSKLHRWTVGLEGAILPKRGLRPEHLEHLLSNCFGTGQSMSWWANTLTERMFVDLDNFAHIEKEAGTFQTLSQLTDWDFVSEWGMELDDHLETNVVNNDPSSVLNWLHSVYRHLRSKAMGTYVHTTAPTARIEVGNRLLSFLATEVLYLPLSESGQEARMLVSPMIVYRNTPMNCRFRLHTALAIAHELCPGHHEHVWRRTYGVMGPYLDCLQSSVGLEGWAVFAEGIMADLSPKGALEMHYSRIRRLMPSAIALTLMEKGRDVANILLQDIASHYPSIVKEGMRYGGGLGWASLPYAVGLVETERALEQMNSAYPKGESVPAITERYLSQGPMTPCLIARLATQAGPREERK
ncbi:hypothetical protein PASE110613_16875 [Paenibacillus sediminis]|uniref:DUF885 domain-containing protein n=1 Tax=Paenibacillus sediminis TaxID=664909 RepID=A0ABS4H7Q6_9BACL|nr:hypothetical protein [Paenibacillus sediminis]MBP1938573.1 hypothetical protein [Paenibacillus sediminis]